MSAELQVSAEKALRLFLRLRGAEINARSFIARGSGLRARVDREVQEVRSRADFEAACGYLLDSKAIQSDLSDGELAALKAAAHDLHKELTGLYSRLEKPVVDVEKSLKDEVVSFCSIEEREHHARELERQAAALERERVLRRREVDALRSVGREQEAAQRERLPLTAPFIPQPYDTDPVSGVSISVTGRRCVIVDPSLLAEDLMKRVPDEERIAQLAAAGGFSVPIPGVEFLPVYRVAVSSSSG